MRVTQLYVPPALLTRTRQRYAAWIVLKHAISMVIIASVGLFLPWRLSNCVLYAMGLWSESGGFLVLRRSTEGRWLHMMYSTDLEHFQELQPVWSKKDWHWKFPPLYFRWKIYHMNRAKVVKKLPWTRSE